MGGRNPKGLDRSLGGCGWRVAAGSLVLVATLGGSAAAWQVVSDLPALMDDYYRDRGGPAPLFAIRPPDIYTHNVGLLQLQITNIGMIGNYFIEAQSAGWRGGEYLFGAGLWVGARGGDGIPHVTTAIYDTEFLPAADPEWTVYEAFEGIENGNRIGFSAKAQDEVVPGSGVGDIRTSGANDDWNGGDDLEWDEDFRNGLDDDDDGLIDEDYEAIGQQMFACQYWDIEEFTQEIEPEHVPMGLLVQQRSFAWATTGANEFIGLDFKVWNISNQSLGDVFISFFVDSDVGPKEVPQYWIDDKGGFTTLDTTFVDESIDAVDPACKLRSATVDIAYMFDTPDLEISEEEGTRGGDVPGYFGGMFLGHSIDPAGVNAPSEVRIRRCQFFSGSEPYPAGDPRNDIERYDLISGSGTPIRETSKPADYRYVISAGPFRELPPDTFLTFQTAFVIGDGKDGMLQNAVQAQLIFDGVWRDVDDNGETGFGGKETCWGATGERWNDPCDTTATQIDIDWPGYCAPNNYVDNDCNGCTPLALNSEPGPETLVNWVGTVAPAPPSTNADPGAVTLRQPAGNRRVILQWDNLSEMKADPIRRQILFEGYRLWRVEGWNRPVGSTGPAPEDWQKIGEYVLHPETPADTCWVSDPEVAGAQVAFTFNVTDHLGNWEPDDPRGLLPDDPCIACPQFCWPIRPFLVDEDLEPIKQNIATGDTTPGMEFADQYGIGRYTFVDSAGIKNGMLYFYDVTAFSSWDEALLDENGDTLQVRHFELSGRPAARENQQIIPTWSAREDTDEIYVVPNPYVQGDRTVLPWGWDLIPSDADPTGTRIAFANLPEGFNTINIYTLAGDLVETIEARATGENGTAFWNLVSRNGQDITSGVYLFTVKTPGAGTKVGRFVVIR